MGSFATMQCTHAGTTMEAFVATPEGTGPFPAVLMFPGATGTTAQFEANACELASLGYLAIGINVYGVDADISTPEKAGEHYMALLQAPDTLRARCLAWFDATAARGDVDAARIAAIGYCFGGKCVLEMARAGADVKSVSSFHGILPTHAPAAPGTIKAEIAVWCAGLDPFVPMSDVEAFRAEMVQSEARHQITVFSAAMHSFTDAEHDDAGIEGIGYDRLAHQVSWAGTLALIGETLGHHRHCV